MIDDGRIQGGRRRFVWQDERDGDGMGLGARYEGSKILGIPRLII